MDRRSSRREDTEVDLESGLLINEDDSNKVCTLGSAKQTQRQTPFANPFSSIAGGTINGEDRPTLYNNESNLSGVSVTDVERVVNKILAGQDLVDREERTPVKEKRKSSSNRKASKPPRPPRAPSLDAADKKLMKEISELAMLKRARIERGKALKKMKATKASSSSSNGNIFALIFTIFFCILIIWQGNLAINSYLELNSFIFFLFLWHVIWKWSSSKFSESYVSKRGTDGGVLITVEYHLNPSASDFNAPRSKSHNFVRLLASSDSSEKIRGTRRCSFTGNENAIAWT